MAEDMNAAVERLIETCKDAERGFKEAAEQAKDSQLKVFFMEQSGERARFVRQLETELDLLGQPGNLRIGGKGIRERGSVAGALHRAWIDVKTSFGGGDHGILTTIESAEDTAKEAYEDALKTDLPPSIREIVRMQATSVRAAHDRIRSMRDQKAA